MPSTELPPPGTAEPTDATAVAAPIPMPVTAARLKRAAIDRLPPRTRSALTGQRDEIAARIASDPALVDPNGGAGGDTLGRPHPATGQNGGETQWPAVLRRVGLACILRSLGPVIPRTHIALLERFNTAEDIGFALQSSLSAPPRPSTDHELNDPEALGRQLTDQLPTPLDAMLGMWAGQPVEEDPALRGLVDRAIEANREPAR